jgi:hypothetical protein
LQALNIPARYFTCYATNINPPDIHACFEVYIGGQWILFDPSLINLSSLVKIAHGKTGQMLRLQIFSEMLLVPI